VEYEVLPCSLTAPDAMKHDLPRGVFGAPTYAVGDELFWGQDRLDFLDRKMAK
jgi:2-hydroxychromene-2-carboxylate isomerase